MGLCCGGCFDAWAAWRVAESGGVAPPDLLLRVPAETVLHEHFLVGAGLAGSYEALGAVFAGRYLEDDACKLGQHLLLGFLAA